MKQDDLRKTIIRDVGVELSEEFDRNFTRKAFFDDPWPKRMRNYSRGTLMLVSGRTRRSLKRRSTTRSLSFTSDAPWFGVHNQGGKIPITPKMRKYFWAKHYEAAGNITTTKTGKISGSKRNAQLSEKAVFYRNMALHKGDRIVIPKRQIVGNHPQVKRIAERVANDAIHQYARTVLAPALKQHR